MKTITLNAPAKVNLALDVIGKREDGYHLLETVFQSVSIYDKLTVTLLEENIIELTCNEPELPCNEKNLAWKAAAAFLRETGLECGFRIYLEKHIPSEAGMGGGSSDAAAVLKGCNILTGEPVPFERLCEIAASLGADVPFFLYGGTAYAEGIGDILTKLPSMPNLHMVAAKGTGGISTPEAYKRIDSLSEPVHPDAKGLRAAIEKGVPLRELWQYCGNLFEAVTDVDDVWNIRRTMIDMGAVFACMSGSGAVVFGIFEDDEAAKKCCALLKDNYPFAECCKMTEV
ncbi:MAG: 4-(cytidine 5'-diphospho)-2-C-methyl-D-erythritol kinase [Ruminococcus sp.]|nr:4-(cytidine 5'-diphospho)-2-C-methyl-D-erythritol kinase [Ruminococcus sp.]